MIKKRNELDDILQHYGVKGMKWGVRKDRGSSVSSLKRELSWVSKSRKKLKESDDEIKKLTTRIRLENELKRLSTKSEYKNRSKLSDSQIKERVARLQLEDNLKQQVRIANKGTIDIGKGIVNSAVLIGAKSLVGGAVIPIIAVEVGKMITRNTADKQNLITKETIDAVTKAIKSKNTK